MGTFNTDPRFSHCWETIVERNDISWVGPSHDAMKLCFGTETGEVIWANLDGKLLWELPLTVKLGEAINGVAFNAGQMCVTTRNETANWFLPTDTDTARTYLGDTIAGGAHGVIADRSDGFFMPLGVAGLQNLFVDSSTTNEHGLVTRLVAKPEKGDANFYSVVSLATAGCDDILACAIRQNGLAMGRFKTGKDFKFITFGNNNFDFIDICSAGITSLPSAAYALTKEGVICPLQNMMSDLRTVAMRFPSVEGTAYRILATGDLVFVLTSRALHVIHKPMDKINSRIEINDDTRQVHFDKVSFDMEAVDMNLVGKNWLLILLPDRVLRLDLKSLKNTLQQFPTETSSRISPEISDQLISRETVAMSQKHESPSSAI